MATRQTSTDADTVATTENVAKPKTAAPEKSVTLTSENGTKVSVPERMVDGLKAKGFSK